MPDWLSAYLQALGTISGVLAGLSLFLAALGHRVVASVIMISVGTGGLAVFWDRWSLRAGDHMSLTALTHPASLSANDAFLVLTHGPFLLAGLGTLWLALRAIPAGSQGE
jgi:hypothetical protein